MPTWGLYGRSRKVGAVFGAASSFIDPSSLLSIASWWDASDTSSITLNGPNECAVWNDKVGTRHLPAAYTYPATGVLTVNGKNTISIPEGSGPKMLLGTMTGFPVAKGTMYIVAKIDSCLDPYGTLIAYDTGNLWLLGNDSGGTKFFGRFAAVGAPLLGGSTDCVGSQHVWKMTWDTAGSGPATIFLDRSSYGTGTGYTGAAANQNMYVGTNWFSGYAMGVRFCEMALCHDLPTSDDDTNMYNYFSAKWGTP